MWHYAKKIDNIFITFQTNLFNLLKHEIQAAKSYKNLIPIKSDKLGSNSDQPL
jgi:hypothetical protein